MLVKSDLVFFCGSVAVTVVQVSRVNALTPLMKGRFNKEPRIGILRIKPITTGKKPLCVGEEKRKGEKLWDGWAVRRKGERKG